MFGCAQKRDFHFHFHDFISILKIKKLKFYGRTAAAIDKFNFTFNSKLNDIYFRFVLIPSQTNLFIYVLGENGHTA